LPQYGTQPAEVAVEIYPETRPAWHLPGGIAIGLDGGIRSAEFPEVQQVLPADIPGGGFLHESADLVAGGRVFSEENVRGSDPEGGGGEIRDERPVHEFPVCMPGSGSGDKSHLPGRNKYID
jgi:hypothetical protein